MTRKMITSEHNPVKEIVMNDNGDFIYSIDIVFDNGSKLVIEGNDLSYYSVEADGE